MTTSNAQPTTCNHCHGPLHPTRAWQRFCCADCRIRWHAQIRRQAFEAYRAQHVDTILDTMQKETSP